MSNRKQLLLTNICCKDIFSSVSEYIKTRKIFWSSAPEWGANNALSL
uniref:Uncharacterized protein n=1 Tax=Romanomermis culicivorax TaxID=13658 RepID=A0A915LDD9_ROMCU